MIIILKKHLSKFSNMSPVAKTSFALVFANFFQKGLAMITAPIFTRIMTQEEYGIIATFLSWEAIIIIIATLNMSSGVFNNGMLEFKNDRNSFTFSILILANLCTLILFTIYLFFRQPINAILGIPDILVYIMFIHFLALPAYNYWVGRQRYEHKYIATLIVTISSSIISTGLAILFVLWAQEGERGLAKIFATETVTISLGVIFYIYIVFRAKFKLKFKYWKYALKINLPLIPHYLSMYILSSADKIMISSLINESATAIYTLAYTVATIILILWNSIDAAYAPWIYQKLEKKDYVPIAKRGNQILMLFAMLSVLSALFAPEIIRVLGPESYYEGIYLIPSVAVGVFFTAIASLYIRVELYLKKSVVIMVATIVAAILKLSLNFIFIPMFGYITAGYTTLICYIVLALMHYFNLKRLGYGKVYDNKFIFITSIVLSVLMISVLFIYPFTIIRYIIIAIILVIAFIKRKEILSLIKKNKMQ